MIEDQLEDETESIWERYRTAWSSLRAAAFSHCMVAGVRFLNEEGDVLDTNCESVLGHLLTGDEKDVSDELVPIRKPSTA